MSVYTTKTSPFWLYDFERGGNRFCGSFNGLKGRLKISKERPEREAERAEAVIRSTAGQPATDKPRITLHDAGERYWHEAAKDFAGASGEFGRIANLERLLGKNTYLDDLTDGDLSHFVARRREESARNKKTSVSAATLNREIEALGRILKRARKVWKVAVPDLDVTDHKLAEPRERIRSLTSDEEDALFKAVAKLRPDFADMIEFALLTGKRLSEVIFLEKRKIDRKAMEARVIQKGGQEIVIPLTKATLAIVERNWLCHPTRLFTYISRRNRKNVRKARRYPFTKDGWRKSWAAALVEAKIEDFRFHDLRHTTATRVLAATGNLKAVQDALSHASIVSSARYAHTTSDQRRQALESAEALRIPEKSRTKKGSNSKSKGATKR
jgi:integrase